MTRPPGRPRLSPAQAAQRQTALAEAARLVTEARARLALSQSQLAALLGVSRSFVSAWERGAKLLPAARRKALRRIVTRRTK